MNSNNQSAFNRRQWLATALVTGAGVSTARAQTSNAAQAGAALARIAPPNGPIPVAVLIDEGATVIDFAGPWEAFQDAGVANVPGFYLYTVAPTLQPITASAGMRIVPNYSLDNAPSPKVVVMGAQTGGRTTTSTTAPKLEWIRSVAGDADIVMSVCTGAFLLARTGFLNGLMSTTHHNYYDDFEHDFPDVSLVRNRRFVDNGKFISAGGLTSGVDGALHVVARYYGEDAARQSAAYMEHHGEGWLSGVQQT